MSREYLDVNEAARELQIPVDRLAALIREGKVVVEKRPEGKPYQWYIRQAVVDSMKNWPEVKESAGR